MLQKCSPSPSGWLPQNAPKMVQKCSKNGPQMVSGRTFDTLHMEYSKSIAIRSPNKVGRPFVWDIAKDNQGRQGTLGEARPRVGRRPADVSNMHKITRGPGGCHQTFGFRHAYEGSFVKNKLAKIKLGLRSNLVNIPAIVTIFKMVTL